MFSPVQNTQSVPVRSATRLRTLKLPHLPVSFLSGKFKLWSSTVYSRAIKAICLSTGILLALTKSMAQSPSWEANWFAASQEIPRISRNPKVHYRTHKRPPPVSILGPPNPVFLHLPMKMTFLRLILVLPPLFHNSFVKSQSYKTNTPFTAGLKTSVRTGHQHQCCELDSKRHNGVRAAFLSTQPAKPVSGIKFMVLWMDVLQHAVNVPFRLIVTHERYK